MVKIARKVNISFLFPTKQGGDHPARNNFPRRLLERKHSIVTDEIRCRRISDSSVFV